MKSAYVLARGDSGHQQTWGGAFAAGLQKHGWKVEVSDHIPSSTGRPEYDLLVMWGVRRKDVIERQKKDGGEVCILERGYLGDRFKWTSVSFGGGLNGRANFRGVTADAARFNAHFSMQPWARRDGYAILVGQVAGDMSLAAVGGDLNSWYRQTASDLRDHGYDVLFRQHPLASRRGGWIVEGVSTIEGTLEDALSGASVAVTFNSNTGVESVLSGVPTITMDGGSMAWDVTSHHVHLPTVTPDRRKWAAEMAWKQWSLDEMASGECWEVVRL